MHSPIRIGIIGVDTSHVTAFTKLLNDPSDPSHVPGGRVVMAYPSQSEDWDKSYTRAPGFIQELTEKWHVPMAEGIPALLREVDAVLLESVDGRRHLGELRQVVKAGKPVFIDKPFAAGLRDAKAMVKLLEKAGVPAWSSSSLRFEKNLEDFLKANPGVQIRGATTWGPAAIEPTQPGWYWYGIHAVEMLYRILGPGCQEVHCVGNEQADVAVGRWADGRIGVVRGNRAGQGEFGATIHCEDRIVSLSRNKEVALYAPLLRNIIAFFQTKQPPVPLSETLEIMAFIDAANKSAARGGKAVEISAAV